MSSRRRRSRSPFLSPATSEDEDGVFSPTDDEPEDDLTRHSESEEELEAQNLERDLLVQLQHLHNRLARVRQGGREASAEPGPAQGGVGENGGGIGGDPEAEEAAAGGEDAGACPRFIDEGRKIIVCCVRKPVCMSKSKSGDAWEYTASRSGFKSSIDFIAEKNPVRWVAWPGACVDEGTQDAVRKRLETEHSCIPVFVSKDIKELFESFCWDTLWPNLHCMSTFFNQSPHRATTKFDLEDTFTAQLEAFSYFNQLYVERVAEIYQPGDLVLVYGYEIMLLPAMLRRRFPDLTCGFFLHCPFPSSEFFRMLPARERFLHGVLGADLIAFNHFDYVRHFLNSCTCILGLQSLPSKLEYNSRQVSIEICPSGIDPLQYRHILNQPLPHQSLSGTTLASSDAGTEASFPTTHPPYMSSSASSGTRDLVIRLTNRFRQDGRKLVVTLDRLDWCKGITQKLMSMDTFFQNYPEWRGKVTFFVAVRDLYGRRDKQLMRLINRLVGEVNGRWGAPDYIPVQYIMRTLTHQEIAALHCAADVALVTSVREGINLSAMEFIACQSALDFMDDDEEDEGAKALRARGKGVLVYSELAGCSSSFKGALVVNPYDSPQVADSINNALVMKKLGRNVRHHQLNRYVSQYTSKLWGIRIIQALKEAGEACQVYNHLSSLDIAHLRSVYERTIHRLLVFDYDGTLMPHLPLPQLSKPSTSLLAALQLLTKDPANSIIIVTGRRREDMEDWFRDIPELGLITDHGYWMRPPTPPPSRDFLVRSPSFGFSISAKLSPPQVTSVHMVSPSEALSPRPHAPVLDSAADGTSWSTTPPRRLSPPPLSLPEALEPSPPFTGSSDVEGLQSSTEPASWIRFDGTLDLTWREQVKSVLQDYTDRTPGSYLEIQDCCLTWHYRDSDADFGVSQARALHLHLDQMTTKLPVRVSTSQVYKFLVVQPSRVSKGRALNHLLSIIQSYSNPVGADPAAADSRGLSQSASAVMQSPSVGGLSAEGQQKPFDFVLCMNDDQTDEDMFNIWRGKAQVQHLHGLFTVTCGGCKTSRAKYSVEDSDEVLVILQAMASVQEERN